MNTYNTDYIEQNTLWIKQHQQQQAQQQITKNYSFNTNKHLISHSRTLLLLFIYLFFLCSSSSRITKKRYTKKSNEVGARAIHRLPS